MIMQLEGVMAFFFLMQHHHRHDLNLHIIHVERRTVYILLGDFATLQYIGHN